MREATIGMPDGVAGAFSRESGVSRRLHSEARRRATPAQRSESTDCTRGVTLAFP